MDRFSSLQNLTESSRKLGSMLLDFISQCQVRKFQNEPLSVKHCVVFCYSIILVKTWEY